MTDAPYTNRELDRMFGEMNRDRQEKHDEVIRAIAAVRVQTEKTNGRVGKLETWRGLLTGGLVVIGAVVIPLVVYAFNLATGK